MRALVVGADPRKGGAADPEHAGAVRRAEELIEAPDPPRLARCQLDRGAGSNLAPAARNKIERRRNRVVGRVVEDGFRAPRGPVGPGLLRHPDEIARPSLDAREPTHRRRVTGERVDGRDDCGPRSVGGDECRSEPGSRAKCTAQVVDLHVRPGGNRPCRLEPAARGRHRDIDGLEVDEHEVRAEVASQRARCREGEGDLRVGREAGIPGDLVEVLPKGSAALVEGAHPGHHIPGDAKHPRPAGGLEKVVEAGDLARFSGRQIDRLAYCHGGAAARQQLQERRLRRRSRVVQHCARPPGRVVLPGRSCHARVESDGLCRPRARHESECRKARTEPSRSGHRPPQPNGEAVTERTISAASGLLSCDAACHQTGGEEGGMEILLVGRPIVIGPMGWPCKRGCCALHSVERSWPKLHAVFDRLVRPVFAPESG